MPMKGLFFLNSSKNLSLAIMKFADLKLFVLYFKKRSENILSSSKILKGAPSTSYFLDVK